MRAKERLEKNVRQVQLILTEDQHRRLKIQAAVDGMAMADLLRHRIVDIIEPMLIQEDTKQTV